MKKSILILLMLSIVTLGYSQRKVKSPFTTSKQSKNKAIYNKNGTTFLPQLTLDYNWEDSVWESDPDTTLATYNNEGLITSEISISSFFGNVFKNRTDFTYSNGLNTASYNFSYSMSTGEWDTSGKSVYTYDNFGNQTTYAYYFYDLNGTWILNNKDSISYIYTGSRIDQEISYVLDITTSTYTRTDKVEYSYDNQNVATGAVFSSWDTSTLAYEIDFRFTDAVWHLWDGSLETSLILYYRLDEWNGSSYDSLERATTSYDEFNNISEELSETYNGSEWELDYWTKYTHTYNTDGALLQTIEQDYDGTEFVNANKYVYSNFFTGLRNIAYNNASVNIYPNPISDKAYISIGNKNEAQFFMYDMTGRMVNSLVISNGEAVIEKGNLQQGVYFFRLVDAAGAVSTGKVVIR